MFPNNPSFLEKLVQTKKEESTREIQDINEYEFQHFRAFHIKSNASYKMWILVGLLIALTWSCSMMF